MGVMTNIITDVKVTNGHSADINESESLLRGTKRTFDVKEVSADKGYLSRENYELAKDIGAKAYIPFKENTRSCAKGSPHGSMRSITSKTT